MAPLRRRGASIDDVVAGYRAQTERSAHFLSTIDPVASAGAYLQVMQLLGPQLTQLRTAANLSAKAAPLEYPRARWGPAPYSAAAIPTGRVFTYWDRPIDQAPPLVQACLAQTRRVYPELRVLDGAGVRELIDIPDRIASLLETHRPAHFADYVRTRILAEHGGLWFDATIWVHRRLDKELQPGMRWGTVFPRWTPDQIGNWFIAAHAGAPLITLQGLALDAWWSAFDDLPDYFLYHRIFEVVNRLVPLVRGQWHATAPLSATQAHLLQLEMMQPWRPDKLGLMLDRFPLQKLSYKYDTVPAGSVLERLEGGLDLT